MRAIAAAGRSSRGVGATRATGASAGAIVSASMTGSTMTRTYQSSASTAIKAAAQTRTRHDQPAAVARFVGTGGQVHGPIKLRGSVNMCPTVRWRGGGRIVDAPGYEPQ